MAGITGASLNTDCFLAGRATPNSSIDSASISATPAAIAIIWITDLFYAPIS
jgi:hypothetical protein